MDLIEQIATNFCTATWLTWENACGLFFKLLTNESFSIARAVSLKAANSWSSPQMSVQKVS